VQADSIKPLYFELNATRLIKFSVGSGIEVLYRCLFDQSLQSKARITPTDSPKLRQVRDP